MLRTGFKHLLGLFLCRQHLLCDLCAELLVRIGRRCPQYGIQDILRCIRVVAGCSVLLTVPARILRMLSDSGCRVRCADQAAVLLCIPDILRCILCKLRSRFTAI